MSEIERDGFSAREMYLMRQAHETGRLAGEGETLDSWLDETISDAGHYVAQHLAHDAERLYGEAARAQQAGSGEAVALNGLSAFEVKALAMKMHRTAEEASDSDDDYPLDVVICDRVMDDDGSIGGPVLCIRDSDYPEEGVWPMPVNQKILDAYTHPQPAQQGSVQEDQRAVSVEWLKRIHRDLDACQKLIWGNVQGCDPAYYKDAKARLSEIDAILATPQTAQQGSVPEGITVEMLDAIWQAGIDAENFDDRDYCQPLIEARIAIEEAATQSDNEALRARANACQQEAQIWKQEARTQSSIVAEIYQELTGKTGEPGDWNGARPLKPAILRKQAEAVEAAAAELTPGFYGPPDDPSPEHTAACEMCADLRDYAQRLRQQADEAEKAGGGDA